MVSYAQFKLKLLFGRGGGLGLDNVGIRLISAEFSLKLPVMVELGNLIVSNSAQYKSSKRYCSILGDNENSMYFKTV